MKTRCPHCEEICTTRKTEQISRMYREITFVCKNIECGHVFVTSLEPVRTLSPSAMPDPMIDIPLSYRHASKLREK
jgi:hypothetical protein